MEGDHARVLAGLTRARLRFEAELRAAELDRTLQWDDMCQAQRRYYRAEEVVAQKQSLLAAAARRERVCDIEEKKTIVLAPLPSDVALIVFKFVPVDSRLRCLEVCRGWRAFLAEAPLSLWAVCDLSSVFRRTHRLLTAAAARARGALEELDISGSSLVQGPPLFGTVEQLRPVLQANTGLRRLRTGRSLLFSAAEIESLLTAAPRLCVLECGARLMGAETRFRIPPLLLDPRFSLVRLNALKIVADGVPPVLDVAGTVARAALHSCIVSLELWDAPLNNEALDAVVELAIMQLRHLQLFNARLSPASLPALTRMLERGSLSKLCIGNSDRALLQGPSLPPFCAALQTSTVVELELRRVDMWSSFSSGQSVIAACTAHQTLRSLDISGNSTEGQAAAVGAALASLCSAVSCRELNVSDSRLGDEGARSFFAAFAADTPLRKLVLMNNLLGAECVCEVILPAARAASSLRELDLGRDNIPELAYTMQLRADIAAGRARLAA